MSKVTDSIKDSIANRKFSKAMVTKTCWNCGHSWKGNSRSFCPRCLGGRLQQKDYKKV